MNQSYYLFSNGQLARRDNSLTLIRENGDVTDIPIERVYDLYCFGEFQYNSALFSFLGSKGVTVHMFNYFDFYVGSFYPKETMVSGNLLIKQVEHFVDDEKRLILAKEFILSGADNIYRNLRYYQERGKDVGEHIEYIEKIKTEIPFSDCVETVMGYEGNIRQKYYNAFNIIINQEINFVKRVKHPPDNMINTLISYCNSLLYTKILSEMYRTQINPTISYLHVPGTKRFSLSLDLSEVFKPLIVDRLIFSLLNRNQITMDDFDEDLGYLRIKEKGVRTIVEEFEKKMKTTIKHRSLNRDVSYQHLLRLEVYKLIKHLMTEKQYAGFRIWW
jgi:CRISPR-associated protein Cas1